MRLSLSAVVGWASLSLALACSNTSDSDADHSGAAGQASGGAGNTATGASNAVADAGQSSGGAAAGGNAAGGSVGVAGVGPSAQEQSEYADLYRTVEAGCRTRSVQVVPALTGVKLNGFGTIAYSFEEVVEGDVRHISWTDPTKSDTLRLAFPASAGGGVEAEASGVLVSKGAPELNVCFEGKAIVGKDFQGEEFDLVASRDVKVANADGTCTDTQLAGSLVLCAPNQSY
jgi:hypothetical protein